MYNFYQQRWQGRIMVLDYPKMGTSEFLPRGPKRRCCGHCAQRDWKWWLPNVQSSTLKPNHLCRTAWKTNWKQPQIFYTLSFQLQLAALSTVQTELAAGRGWGVGSRLLEALMGPFADSQLFPDYLPGCKGEWCLGSPSLPSLVPGDPRNEEGNHMLPVASCTFPAGGFSDGSLLCWNRGNQFCCCSTGQQLKKINVQKKKIQNLTIPLETVQ